MTTFQHANRFQSSRSWPALRKKRPKGENLGEESLTTYSTSGSLNRHRSFTLVVAEIVDDMLLPVVAK